MKISGLLYLVLVFCFSLCLAGCVTPDAGSREGGMIAGYLVPLEPVIVPIVIAGLCSGAVLGVPVGIGIGIKTLVDPPPDLEYQRIEYAPLEKLVELAKSPSIRMRNAVAMAKNVSQEILAELACDAHPYVLIAVASNPRTPPTSLEKLASDQRLCVRRKLAKNPAASEKTLAILAKDIDFVRYAVAVNPNASPSILDSLANDPNVDICSAIVEHHNTTVATLEKMAASNNSVIAKMAKNRLTCRGSAIQKPGHKGCHSGARASNSCN